MATSLAKQLERLKTPQTQTLVASKKGVSILFDSREATNITFDESLQISLEGLRELEKLEPRFTEFEKLLFSDATRGLQRAVQTKDVNQKLDEHIRRFLLLLSPHMLLKPALSTLEWLVKRFRIGEYNAEDLILSALPYHGSRTFVLILRAVPELKNPQSPWHWLLPVADTGTPMDTLALHSILASNLALLRRVCNFALTAYKTYPRGETGKLQVLFTFSTAAMLGVLQQSCTQASLACIIPLLRAGLSSNTSCLAAGCLAVTAHIVARAPLAMRISDEFLLQLFNMKVSSLYTETASVLLLIFSAQPRLGVSISLPPNVVLSHLPSLSWLPATLAKIATPNEGTQINVLPLVLPVLNVLLGEVHKLPDERAKSAAQLTSALLETITFSRSQAIEIIRQVFMYLPDPVMEGQEENAVLELHEWFTTTCHSLEKSYPEAYDAETQEALEANSSLAVRLREVLGLQILNIGKEVGAVVTPKRLLTCLLHPEPTVRAAAVTCLDKSFHSIPVEEHEWVKQAVKERLHDEDMSVVHATLKMSCLRDLLGGDEPLIEAIVHLLDTTPYKNWTKQALAVAIKLLCNTIQEDEGEMRQLCLLLVMLPPLVVNPTLLSDVVDTPLSRFCPLLQSIEKSITDGGETTKGSGAWLLWAAQKAMALAPTQSMELVKFRLNQQKREPNGVELFLLCGMLGAVANKFTTNENALHCLHLLLQAKSAAKKVMRLNTKTFPPMGNAQLAKEMYHQVVILEALPMQSVLAVLRSLAARPIVSNAKSSRPVLRWCDLSTGDDLTEESFELGTELLKLFLEMSIHPSDNEVSPSMYGLTLLLRNSFPSTAQQLHLLTLLWTSPKTSDEHVIRAIGFCRALIRHKIKETIAALKLNPESTLVPSLLYLLCDETSEVRVAVMNLLKDLVEIDSTVTEYNCILLPLVSRDLELLEDNNQLSVVFYTLFSPDPTVKKLFGASNSDGMESARKCLVAHCCSPHTPRHVTACLLRAMRHVHSEEMLIEVASLGSLLLSQSWPDNQLDGHSWEVLTLILERLQNECIAPALSNDEVWKLLNDVLQTPLSHGEKCVAVVALDNLSCDLFTKLEMPMQSKLVSLLLSMPKNLSREVTATLRRLPLDIPLIDEQLKALMVPPPQPRALRSRGPAPTQPIVIVANFINSDNWRRGLLLLESLQEKRKLKGAEELLSTLCQVLRTSLEVGSEQEYCKQLVLGCMSNCVQDFTTQTTEAATTKLHVLDVELLVQCLRGTNNPHTQHQTLLLLAKTASILPGTGLLHHLVSVFTFMGSLVMRHDDPYSFQVIAEVIDKLVPVIVKTQQSGGKAIVSVLHVFVDALPDIPSHRRAPVFSQLMQVLGWNKLWLFLALVAEAPPPPQEEGKPKHKSPKVSCALELASVCPLSALLAACTDTLAYLSVLATIKYGEQKQVLNAAEIRDKLSKCGADKLYNPTNKLSGETKRLQASYLSLLTDILAAKNPPEQSENEEADEMKGPEELYQALMEALMSYLGLVSKQEQSSRGQGTSKFWPAMLHHAYTLLNKVNLLLPTRQFLGVIRGVLESSTGDEGVRARALEVLGARLQLRAAAQLNQQERTELLALTPGLRKLALGGNGPASERALFCLRILAHQLASSAPHTFSPVLGSLVQLLSDPKSEPSTAIQAGMLLCVAELCGSLKAAAVPTLPRLVPLVLQLSATNRCGPNANELVLLGATASLQKLVETLPNFLSPFLPGVLRELCLLSSSTPSHVSTRALAVINPRLTAIRSGVGNIALRVLLPATSTVFAELRDDVNSLAALGPLLDVLSASFADLERVQVDARITELTKFFMSALELRADWDAKLGDRTEEERQLVTEAEDKIIAALVALVMKLPETVFRPLYFQLSAWSSQAEQIPSQCYRCITFYRCSTSLANSLKGLFVVFAFYFLKQAAGLLRRCHSASQEAPIFSNEHQTCLLLNSLLETLLAVCTHDKQNFVNKECFDAIMQPLVDQLENMVGGETALRERCAKLVSPCLAQFARATADEMLWKQLHYQILLKTRHTSPTVRLVSVGAVKCLATALGEELLPLLPEAVPFLAELLEDEDAEVETACQDAVRDLERILGEPLHKYF